MDQIIRSFVATVDDVNPSERSIVAKISAGNVDRLHTIVDPLGIDLTAYRENPVVLYEHGKDPSRGRIPIGRNLWVKTDRTGTGRLIAKTRFLDDPFSSMLYECYRDGTMRGWSVQVLPKVASAPTVQERRLRDDLDACDMIYRASELLEYSAVVIPGNAETLTMPELRSIEQLVVRGFWSPDEETKTAIERMCESNGMADGGALVKERSVDDADDDESSDDEKDDEKEGDDESPKKKKKQASKSEDAKDADESDDSESRSLEDGDEPPDDDEDESRSEPESENVQRSIEPEPAIEPEPEIDPLASLPPLVGRSFGEVVGEYAEMIHAWKTENAKHIREFHDWLHGRA